MKMVLLFMCVRVKYSNLNKGKVSVVWNISYPHNTVGR